MAGIVRTQKEIDRVLNWVAEGEEKGSHFSGMSYESGIRAGIEWLLGETDERPDQDA
jgi:hypothetical protein